MVELRAEIENLLERCRLAVLNHVEALGLPLQFSTARLIVDRESSTAWSTDRVVGNRNAFETWSGELLAGALGKDASSKVLDLADRLTASFTDTLPFWSPFVGHGPNLATWGMEGHNPPHEEDPARWIAGHLVMPVVLAYLQGIDSLAEPSETLLRRLSGQLLVAAGETHWRVTSSISVAGLETGADIVETDLIRVRRLTGHEQGFLATQLGFSDGYRSFLGFVDLPSHVIEIESTMDRARQPALGGVACSALTAFLLHGYELAGPESADTGVTPRWLCPMTWGEPTRLARRVMTSHPVDVEQLQEISRTAALLDGRKIAEPATPQDLALRRFAVGCGREDPLDALLDLVIALEALLLPYDRQARTSDLSYRFRLHGALYLSDDRQDRTTVWDQLSDLYNIRSRAVHGSKYPQHGEAREWGAVARQLASKGLLKAVHDGFPKATDFREHIFQGE